MKRERGTFRDRTGHLWRLRIDYGYLVAADCDLHLDLLAADAAGRLRRDGVLMGKAIYLACRAASDIRRLGEGQFMALIAPRQVRAAATMAFGEAVYDFGRSLRG